MAHRSRLMIRTMTAATGVLLLATACTSQPAGTSTSASTSTATVMATAATEMTPDRPVPTGTANDLSSGSAHHQIGLDGESFKLKIDYFSTGDATAWTPLGEKNVHLLAYLLPAAGATAPQVMIDNVQAQYRLLAANTDLNGLVVDRTVDQAGATGFLITPKISYGSVLTTAGVTTDMLTRWLALGGRPPIDDVTLQKAGVYGFTVAVSFRLLVRNAGDTGWHRRTVDDQLTVPISPLAASTPTPAAAPTS